MSTKVPSKSRNRAQEEASSSESVMRPTVAEALLRGQCTRTLDPVGLCLRRHGKLPQAVYRLDSERKPLTSIGLPDGSVKNMVHCSPGSPGKRCWGSKMKDVPA